MGAIAALFARRFIPAFGGKLLSDIRITVRIEFRAHPEFTLAQIVAGDGMDNRRKQQNRCQVSNGHTSHNDIGQLPDQREADKRSADNGANGSDSQ